MMGDKEEWKPVPDWENLYEVSDKGRVRSLRSGKFMTQHRQDKKNEHRKVRLSRDGKGTTKRVHQLVMLAFVGHPKPGQIVRHLDDNPLNNLLSNLVYGTKSDNSYDSVRNGKHTWASRGKCKNGHTLGGDNVHPSSGSARRCKQCHKAAGTRRSIEVGDGSDVA
jgi:hypothetical protein